MRMPRVMMALAAVFLFGVAAAQADTIILNSNHTYGSIDINVQVVNQGAQYLWQYTVTNNGYDPFPGLTNGFSGFELGLPVFVPDIGNITAPNGLWESDCCSGLPVEWDIRDTAGLGIMPGETGVFSFTTLPRYITNSTGWYHSWLYGSQVEILYYESFGVAGPEAPDLRRPPVPEPASILLLGSGAVAVFRRLRRKAA